MNKEEKAAVVDKLAGELKDADSIFAIDYRGISVPQAAELRSQLREADTSFRVVKNRLTLRAADAAGAEPIKAVLVGPTALALVNGDVALAAKTIAKLGTEWELLGYKGGVMDGDVLDEDSFQAIARLPGRDQLNAQFAGVVASPLTGLVRGLGSMIQGLALQLQQVAEQGLVSGEAPPEQASAEEDSPPDPEPGESPEETTEEEAPADAEPGDAEIDNEATEEGDADIGSAQEGADESGENETSEDSEETKEDGE